MKILLIDERSDTMEFLKDSMISYGFNAAIAKNKDDACKLLSDSQHDLILINGCHRDLQESDYAEFQRSSTFIICLKGNRREPGPGIGVDVYLQRPFAVSRLLRTIERRLPNQSLNDMP